MSKKSYFLLLLLISFTGFAAPPVLNPPANIMVCQDTVFDLTNLYPQILGGGENPSLYSASYHLSLADANAGTNPITNPNTYVLNFSHMVYIRVEEIANPTDFAVVSFNITVQPMPFATMSVSSNTVCEGGSNELILFEGINGIPPYIFYYSIDGGAMQSIMTSGVNFASIEIPSLPVGTHVISLIGVESLGGGPGICSNPQSQTEVINVIASPSLAEPVDVMIEQIPYIGTAVFDMTINDAVLMNGDPNVTVTYHATMVDAYNDVNPIVNPATYSAANGTIIWAKIQHQSIFCIGVKSFGLYITNPDFVFIPDAAFKNILVISDGVNQAAQDLTHNFTSVDANGDGQIQYSEAANISLLNIPQQGIVDLTGLEAFPNISWLNVGYSNVTSIPTTALPLLTDLNVAHSNLTSLNLTNNPLLNSLSCEYNNLVSLDLSPCPLLNFVHCQVNHLSTLNLTGLVNLTDLVASNNNLTSLNTNDLNSIISFDVDENNISSLDTSGMSTVVTLICPYNDIDSLDTTGCTALTSLRCNANQMSFLDVSDSISLTNLECGQNTLINLDLSNNSLLCSLNCSNNPTMNFISIKNGVDSCFTNFNVLFITNMLQQFCCDDNEVAYFKNYFLTQQGINVNVNSYCSFTPGGDYNTINATATFDANNNGCGLGDNVYPNLRVNINDGTNSGAAFTGITGGAQFFTQAGNFTITPAIENPSWFTISPPSAIIPFANTSNNTANQSFCITANGGHPDLEVVFAPITTARPGFNAIYKLVYRNKGNQTMSGTISLTYEDAVLNFLSSDVPPTTQATGLLNYSFANIAPFESRSFYLNFRVNAPTDTPPVNIGQILNFQAVISSLDGDDNPADNTFPFHQTVVGSYDPNDIVCLEGNIVSPIEIGNYLHYIINFENTGNADAENIVVRELIDETQFDVNTLQLLNSSAAVTTRLTGNLAEFIFPSINLHSGGHGNILLKIRSNNTLTEGDIVSKRANIYFDYNFPVETLPEDTIFQLLSNPDVDIDSSVSIYPNPTKGIINIECDNTIKSVQLYDVQGRILQTNVVNENQASLDISAQSKGVYFIKIISDNGMKVQKLVRD